MRKIKSEHSTLSVQDPIITPFICLNTIRAREREKSSIERKRQEQSGKNVRLENRKAKKFIQQDKHFTTKLQ